MKERDEAVCRHGALVEEHFSDTNVIGSSANLLDGQPVLTRFQCSRREGEKDCHVVFVGIKPGQLLAVEQHLPRLLDILLTHSQTGAPDHDSRLDNRGAVQRVREAIARSALAPGRGPMLRLDAREPADALLELSAAIEAMQ